MSDLEYFQDLMEGFSNMFHGEEHQFQHGTKARFWLQNAKLRVANVHLQRQKLVHLQQKMEVIPKNEAELQELLKTIELIHPALQEYGKTPSFMFIRISRHRMSLSNLLLGPSIDEIFPIVQ